MNKLAEKLKQQELDARLLNWGRWLRSGAKPKLGYPGQSPFVVSPSRGSTIAELDAQHIEDIVSSLYVSGLPRANLQAFILRVEYVEKPTGQMPHVSQRAADVRRKYKCRCGERTYYNHLAKAKKMVEMFADPIK